jgi:transcriptional regulator with XRE-family HTH domain
MMDGQLIRFRIDQVYPKPDIACKWSLDNESMALRDVLLANIERLMKARGIRNMTELARLSDVPQSVLSRFKTGKHGSISLEAVEKLARVFEVPAFELLDPTTGDPRTAKVLAAMESLPDWAKDAVAASAAALVASTGQQRPM